MSSQTPEAQPPVAVPGSAAASAATAGSAVTSSAGGPGQPAPSPRATGARLVRRLSTASETWTLLALIILIVFFSAKAPGKFDSITNFSLMGQNNAWYLVMAVGQTFVILTAGIDLSVGAVLVLSGVVADLYCIHHGGTNAGWGTIIIGCIFGLLTGAGWGALQGFLVAKLKVAPLIATLAGLGAATGAAYLVTGGADFRTVPSNLVNTVGLGSALGIPWLIIISFGSAIIFGLVLGVTRFGRYTYAIGSNPEAARRVGINVDLHLIKVYALCGLMSGLAGVLSLANFDSTTIAGHSFDNLTVITGVVLGGASLFGGRGTMLGTVIGLAIPAVLASGLVIINVNQYWQDVAIGAVLAAAVYFDQFRRRLRERV